MWSLAPYGYLADTVFLLSSYWGESYRRGRSPSHTPEYCPQCRLDLRFFLDTLRTKLLELGTGLGNGSTQAPSPCMCVSFGIPATYCLIPRTNAVGRTAGSSKGHVYRVQLPFLPWRGAQASSSMSPSGWMPAPDLL